MGLTPSRCGTRRSALTTVKRELSLLLCSLYFWDVLNGPGPRDVPRPEAGLCMFLLFGRQGEKEEEETLFLQRKKGINGKVWVWSLQASVELKLS